MANIRRLLSVGCALVAALAVVSGTATSTIPVPSPSAPTASGAPAPSSRSGSSGSAPVLQFDQSDTSGAAGGAIAGGSTAQRPDPGSEPALTSSAAPSSTVWTLDIYDRRAPRFQDPDMTACTAATTISMLNTIAYSGLDPTLRWKPTVSFARQESILSYERTHMTMLRSSPGTDPHGWRNALNYFGWGSAEAGVYRDASYPTIGQAEVAVVMALARYRKPIGLTTQYGQHAEFVTGYKVKGRDPRTGSLDWQLLGVYVTDPWHSAHYANFYLTQDRWENGWTWYRLSPYMEIDSPYRDRLDGMVGRSEWYAKWVILEPSR